MKTKVKRYRFYKCSQCNKKFIYKKCALNHKSKLNHQGNVVVSDETKFQYGI